VRLSCQSEKRNENAHLHVHTCTYMTSVSRIGLV